MFPNMFSSKPLALNSELAQSALASVSNFHDGVLKSSKIHGDVLDLMFVEPYFPAQRKYCAFGIKGSHLKVRVLESLENADNDLQVLSQLSDRIVFECIFDSDNGMLSYLDAGLPDMLKVAFDPSASFIRWF